MAFAIPVENGSLSCPACGRVLEPLGGIEERDAVCPGCRSSLNVHLFPAWLSTPALDAPRFERALDGEAVCFFHPSNRAALPCDSCGRFLCAICDLPIGSRHLCPVCLSNGLGKEKLSEIIPRRFLWSRASFLLGLWPVIFFFVWPTLIVSGGLAVILALFGWKRPGSLVRGRQRWAAVLGILLGLVQIALWVGFIFLIAYAGKVTR